MTTHDRSTPRSGGLKDKAVRLRAAVGGKAVFTVDDAVGVLGGARSSVLWTLWKLHETAVIVRRGKGQYSFQHDRPSLRLQPSVAGRLVHEMLSAAGFSFILSGLDILAPFTQHVPEQFPVLLFVEPATVDEAQALLVKGGLTVLTMPAGKRARKVMTFPAEHRGEVWLYASQELTFANGGFAEPERAFVDLYVAVTRHDYPLSLPELARVFIAMQERGAIRVPVITKAASRRSLQEDIRHLLDAPRISAPARRLAELIDRGGV